LKGINFYFIFSLQVGEVVTTIPTIGFNVEQVIHLIIFKKYLFLGDLQKS